MRGSTRSPSMTSGESASGSRKATPTTWRSATTTSSGGDKREHPQHKAATAPPHSSRRGSARGLHARLRTERERTRLSARSTCGMHRPQSRRMCAASRRCASHNRGQELTLLGESSLDGPDHVMNPIMLTPASVRNGDEPTIAYVVRVFNDRCSGLDQSGCHSLYVVDCPEPGRASHASAVTCEVESEYRRVVAVRFDVSVPDAARVVMERFDAKQAAEDRLGLGEISPRSPLSSRARRS